MVFAAGYGLRTVAVIKNELVPYDFLPRPQLKLGMENLLHCYALGQVPRFIYIKTFGEAHVVTQQLQGYYA